jgi:hypothetical protein
MIRAGRAFWGTMTCHLPHFFMYFGIEEHESAILEG